MPKEFNINDIGSINLKEAEDIAREEILLFTEKDLISDLEDLDLLQPKDSEYLQPARGQDPVSVIVTAPPRKDIVSTPSSESAAPVTEPDFDDGRKWIPLEQLDNIDHDDREWIPIEQMAEETADSVTEVEELPVPVEELPAPVDEIPLPVEKITEPVYEHELEMREEVPEMNRVVDESELDAIAGEIVQLEEGTSYVMKEANIEEDRELIAEVPNRFESDFDELSADSALKFQDEELEYIHAAIVKDDYNQYIWEIDEFYGSTGGKTVSTAVDLLGLTSDEYDSIEDSMFGKDFKNTGMMDRHLLFEYGKKKQGQGVSGRENFLYLLPREDSLADHERTSIESDVSSDTALIIEEDVEEIRSVFRRKTGRDVSDDYAVDPVTDITDRVVILDDSSDVDRFLSAYPEKKQSNIKMMLKYLDGLFEKLPEEVIKKFAGSEYFDLYLKVLNEIGV